MNKGNVACIHNRIIFSRKKAVKILPFAAQCMKLEDIVLREIRQTKNNKYCKFSLIYGN